MNESVETLVQSFRDATTEEFRDGLDKIEHCLKQLTEEQVWWRPNESMNSVGNLALHLCGNLGQLILSSVGGAPDQRDRPAEFAERGPIGKEVLCDLLRRRVHDVLRVLGEVDATELLRSRPLKRGAFSGTRTILRALSHFRGHEQEIIHMTRFQLKDAYVFSN